MAPTSLAAAGVEFCVKLGPVRRDYIASMQITNHQAILPLGQVKGHQQT
jgi:hypothetical protein